MKKELDLDPIKQRLDDAKWADETDQRGAVELWIPLGIAELYAHAQEDITALIAEVEYWKDKYLNPTANGL